MAACEQCATRLGPLRRSHARYCSSRCRVAAHRARRAQRLPAALLERDRWVRYSSDKVPLRLDGCAASVADASTWSAHAEAAASTAGVGLGFVLNGDGIVAIDVDNCLDGGDLAPWAARILERIPSTYAEVSPSGRGLHLFGYGTVTRGRRYNVGDGLVEVYGNGRYLTVTGERFAHAPWVLADLGNLDAIELDP